MTLVSVNGFHVGYAAFGNVEFPEGMAGNAVLC